MKYALSLFFLCAGLLALWQWHRLDQLGQRESALRTLVSGVKELPAIAGRSTPAAKSAPASAAGPLPIDAEHFFELAVEISAIEGGTRNGESREKLQSKITELFSRLAVTSAPTLKAIMDDLPGSAVSNDGKNQISLAIINALAHSDPASAADYALRRKLKPETLEMAIRTWAKKDSAAATAWLEKTSAEGALPPGVNAGELRLLLFPSRIAADPGGAAVEQMAELPPGKLQGVLAGTARLLTTAEQRRQFLQKIISLPGIPSEAVPQFIGQVGRESSFEAAGALLTETASGLSPGQHDRAAAAAATARIDAGTAARADWLLTNLRDADRGPAISTLITAWTQADYNGAATWLRNQPASPDHDAAVAVFAPLVAATEPASAVDWAATIADPVRKEAVLKKLYGEWQATAPEAATGYFQKKGLSVP
ncbi:MAG TPA: hypothetical protein VHM91_17055 [Verrucomicrobiales bacterium]|nr:hypothetical protein [Verrucomicrobiales bacterium]